MKAFLKSLTGLAAAVLCVFAAGTMTAADAAREFADGDAPAMHQQNGRPWVFVSLTPSPSMSGRQAYAVIKRLSRNSNGLIKHFSEITAEWVAEKQPAFIVLSPQGTPWCRYNGERGIALQNFLWTLPLMAEEMHIPMLGICGGHQALALAFGGKVGPLRAGEDDCLPYSRDRQLGVIPLKVTAPDPIFSGIEGSLRIVESHFDEVKILPKGFVLLASEKESPIQIMRHPSRPVYGIQGHPEHFSESRPDGGLLIRNFLKIAALYNETVRPTARQEAPKILSLH